MSDAAAPEAPIDWLGGPSQVEPLVERFYDFMSDHEPELARLHQLDERSKVSRETRERFSLFLVEWLGGAREYSRLYGHPRLRMRHAHVPIDEGMRDAWMRAMTAALRGAQLPEPHFDFLLERLAHVANFLRNTGPIVGKVT